MEAVAAFSLAANVLGVLSFCIDLHSVYTDIRRDGSSVGVSDVRFIAEQLKEQCGKMDIAYQKAVGAKTPVDPDEVRSTQEPRSG